MDKKDWKYQWSSKIENGEIVVVRNDDWEELILDIQRAKAVSTPVVQNKPLETQPALTRTPIEDSSEDDICPVHKVKMKEREGKNGLFYSHNKGIYPDLEWCSGKGY